MKEEMVISSRDSCLFLYSLSVMLDLLAILLSSWMNHYLERLILKILHLCVFPASFALTACAFVFILVSIQGVQCMKLVSPL